MAKLLQLQDGNVGLKIPLAQVQTRIGRDENNDISLEDVLVSKQHAVIEIVFNEAVEGEYDYILQDLESTNHTYVNDEVINLHRLQHGDIIRIGTTNFRFDNAEPLKPEETAKLHKTWIPGVYVTKKKDTSKKTKKQTRK